MAWSFGIRATLSLHFICCSLVSIAYCMFTFGDMYKDVIQNFSNLVHHIKNVNVIYNMYLCIFCNLEKKNSDFILVNFL
jgi:hypothetical protein